MCYFNYLEARHFLGMNDKYLYGMLLESVTQPFDEAVMIYLEMLKIFFPAGQDLAPINTHEKYA